MVRASGGIRGDNVTTSNTGGYFGDQSTSNGAFSGFAAATVGPFSGFSVTGQVSRGFRDPTLSDRYFRGPSGRGFITGNPDLEPETSLQFDVAAATRSAALADRRRTFYHYRIDDLIERYSTQTDFFFFRNRGRGRVKGMEVESRTDLGLGLLARARRPDRPRRALEDDGRTSTTSLRTRSWRSCARTSASARYAQVRLAFLAEDDRPGPSEIVAPGANVIDLAGGYHLTRNLELRGIVRNLLDDSYYASPDPRWVWAAGRSGRLRWPSLLIKTAD